LNDLPEYYFRVRENGAFVFSIDTQNRQRRIEMDQIAVVNIKSGQIKPHGDRVLTATDLAEITKWMESRKALLAQRNLDDIHRAIDYLNTTTHWVNSMADDDELENITDSLLLAMHDLRSVLVRKKADRLMKASKDRLAGE
jgi:DNA phosphorothioation-dependent restriction protein DptG